MKLPGEPQITALVNIGITIAKSRSTILLLTLLQKSMDATLSWRKWEKVVKIYPKYLLIAHKKADIDHQSRRKLIANVENRVIAAESLFN